MDSIDIVDTPASQFCDRSTREGSVSQKSFDGGDGHQFDWLRTRRGHAGVDGEVSPSRHLGHLGGGECSELSLFQSTD